MSPSSSRPWLPRLMAGPPSWAGDWAELPEDEASECGREISSRARTWGQREKGGEG